VLHTRETLNALAAIPVDQRTPAQLTKLRMAFLDQFAPPKILQARAALAVARRERKSFYDSMPTVMVMKEREDRRDSFILKRGAYDAQGEKVTPNTPAFLPAMNPDWPKNRLGLAYWLTDRGNPLTARAAVNRFWASLFGVGLVKTVEDFGSQG